MQPKNVEFQVLIVGDEKIVSEAREKIKEYAKQKGIENIEYKMSVDNKDDIGEEYIELID